MVKTVVTIEAPRPRVYSVLADFSRYQEWAPNCTNSKVVTKTDTVVNTELTSSVPKKMTMEMRWELQQDQLLSFKLTKCPDLKAYEGSWRLIDSADGSGTVVMGEMEMEVGGIPKFIVSKVAKKGIDETAAAIQKRVMSLPAPQATAAAPAEEGGKAAAPKTRPQRMLQVTKIRGGYRIWWMGEVFMLNQATNVHSTGK